MGLSVEPRSVSRSYAFLVGALMFGLPLLISYYGVGQGGTPALTSVILYLAVSAAAGLTLLLRRGEPSGNRAEPPRTDLGQLAAGASGKAPVLVLSLATLAVASFGVMKFSIASSYPSPSDTANLAGGIYIVALGLAAAIGIPHAVIRVFPFLKQAFAVNRLKRAAIILGVLYFVTYEILVNEIVVTGYNTPPGNFVQSPQGIYPWAYVFTSGPAPGNAIESVIYTPYVLVQMNQYVNFIFQPFELVLAVAISVLVASAVVSTYHLVRRSESMGGACSVSATLSGVGAFLGYTATCPSCLAPTLVSVVFGGLAAVQGLYSNLWGAVIPPIVSVVALLFSLYVVGKGYGVRTTPKPPSQNL